MRGFRRCFGLLGLLLGLVVWGRAAAFAVIDPGAPVAGQSQLALSEQWWKWSMGIPFPNNPIADTTGAFAGINNGGPVFFIAGTTGNEAIRSFNVPLGKPIFFPLLNAIDIESPTLLPSCLASNPAERPFSGTPFECALKWIYNPATRNPTLFATLDGQNLLTFPSFFQISTDFFDLMLADPNFFGPSVPGGLYSAASIGDWVALEGLSAGPHTLVFGGQDGGFGVRVTANINVVPEPPMWVVVLTGLMLTALWRRRVQ